MASKSNKGKVSRREDKELHIGPCSLCDEPALAYCKTCQQFLCHDCKTGHKKQKQTRGHEVSDIASVGQCLFHPNNEIKHFCKTCKNVCCNDCIKEKHQGHKYRDVSGYIRQMKNVCQDKAKDIRESFDWMVSKRSTSKATRDTRVKQYEDVKRTLQDRKRILIDLITTIADEEIENVSKAQTEVEKEFNYHENKMGASIKRCEQVLAPVMSVVMGSDVDQVTLCLQQLDSELGNALEAKKSFESLENKPVARVVALDDNLTMISDTVKTVFKVDESGGSKHKGATGNTRQHRKQKKRFSDTDEKSDSDQDIEKSDSDQDIEKSGSDQDIEESDSDQDIGNTRTPFVEGSTDIRKCLQCGKMYERPPLAGWACSRECFDKYCGNKQ